MWQNVGEEGMKQEKDVEQLFGLTGGKWQIKFIDTFHEGFEII